MGFRLNIATEAPTKDNNRLYIFNEDYIILEGGAWELDISDLLKQNCQEINIRKSECTSYPNCSWCDCSDDTWYKINIEDLKSKDDILKNNINIAGAFLLNSDKIDDDLWEDKSVCSYDFIINQPHREYIWINIS